MKALITGVSQDSGLAAARSLARAGFAVLGADDRDIPRALQSRFLCAHYRLPRAGDREFADALLRLIGATRPDIFLPLGTRGVRGGAPTR